MAVQYLTLERIAVGGMGEVFLARQEGLGGFRRTVVLKRLLPDAEGDDESTHRFLDEARVAAVLAHENVVSVLEVGDDGAPYLALEYVHGENAGRLRTRAKRQGMAFPVVAAARIIADAARGLAHAHEACDVDGRPLHIVHRDVAPKNIFVRVDGTAKIGDFGIARSDRRLAHTATGAVPGTLSYMAPEQARGDDVDARADQFSLGIVLWELLTGRALFKADSPDETLRNVLGRLIPPPSSLRPEAAALDRVAKRMLARKPEERFPSLAEAAAAIEHALPEAEGASGKDAVAALVEALAGDDLRERQARIEAGADQTVRVIRPGSSSSFPRIGPTSSPSDTPATRSIVTDAEDATVPMRPVPRSVARPPLRMLAAALATVLVVAGAAALATRALVHPPSEAERTRAYLEEARAANPILHRAVFLAMADLAHVDEKRAAPVADELIALLAQRLDLLLADAKHPRTDRQTLAAEEHALLARARAALAKLGDDDLARDELDMWDYDAGAPIQWLPPDKPVDIQRDLVEGGLAYLKGQAAMRALATDKLLAEAKVDARAVHAWLDPLVTEREQLVVASATAPEQDLLALDRRIAALAAGGEAKLRALCGPAMGHAVAEVAFETVSGPEEWSPLFATPPSARDARAEPGAVPTVH